MTDASVPTSPADSFVEQAILARVSRPFVPEEVPEAVISAIMDLGLGASEEDQDKVRKAWNDHKAEAATASPAPIINTPTVVHPEGPNA